MTLIASLGNDGPIRVVMGSYGPPFHDFIDPKSPEGKLLAMDWVVIMVLLGTLCDWGPWIVPEK